MAVVLGTCFGWVWARLYRTCLDWAGPSLDMLGSFFADTCKLKMNVILKQSILEHSRCLFRLILIPRPEGGDFWISLFLDMLFYAGLSALPGIWIIHFYPPLSMLILHYLRLSSYLWIIRTLYYKNHLWYPWVNITQVYRHINSCIALLHPSILMWPPDKVSLLKHAVTWWENGWHVWI